MEKFDITFGGWYQRTTLHLSEIYGFLAHGFSKLNLSKERLGEFREKLNLKEVTREVGYLEYVKATTEEGIEIRYYEDGLYILEISSEDIKKGQKILKEYFEERFNPAISYIFSLGAPTPKVLANIKSTHPTVVGVNSEKAESFEIDQKEFGEIYNKITAEDITVLKSEDYIFIVGKKGQKLVIRDLIEMQIFFREFKDQLEKYLNIHRNIWEEISDIKERRFIKGGEVSPIRIKLDKYRTTIDLINSRINQMSSYINTRASISKDLKIEKHLVDLFEYKFEVLADTHTYIKEIWSMTRMYLSSAIDVIRDIESNSVNNSIRSLQVISSIGVVSGVLGYLTAESFPSITSFGVIYFIILAMIVLPINYLISSLYRNLKYEVNFPETEKNI